MSSPTPEPRNPLYLLLLLAGVVFIATTLAVAVVPVLEEKAAEKGSPPPPSPFRAALRKDGWKWVLYEVAALVVLGVASMWLDSVRLRGLQKRQEGERMPPKSENPSPTSGVPNEDSRSTDRGTE
jgi:hypothetical protein